MAERYRTAGRHAVGAALEADPIDRHGARSDIAGHGETGAAGRIDDDACRAAHSDQRDCLIYDHVFGIGACRDQDGVAIHGRIDCVLDGGETAIADQQEAAACGPHRIRALDNLHAGERVGAFTEAVGIDLPARDAGTVGIGIRDGGEVRGLQHAVVDGRVGAAAADQRVVAGAAFERVVADLACGTAARLVGAIELVVTVAATQRIVAALAHDPVITRGAGNGLANSRLAGLVALDLGVDVGPCRQRDGEARDIDRRIGDAVDVEQRAPVADSTREVEIVDRQPVEFIKIEDRDRVLVVLARDRDIGEHHRSDVRLVCRNRVGVAGVKETAGDFDRIVRTSGRTGYTGRALKRHILEGGVAIITEQLDVGGVAGARAVGREAGIGDHQRIHRRGTGRIPGVGREDAAIGEARDRAVGEAQRANRRASSHVDAGDRNACAVEIDIVERHVACPAGDVHRRASSGINRDRPDADEGQRLADGQILGVAAGLDLDRVAVEC